MRGYFIERGLIGFLTVFLIVTITFFLLKAIPGGPFDKAKNLPPAIKANIEAQYKLRDPLWVQYTSYMTNLAKGDMGLSFRYQGQKVEDIIKRTFPISAILGILALSISLLVGGTLGVYSAIKKDLWQDHLILAIITLGFSIPNFILATGLIYLFSYKLGWFPPALWGTPQQAILPIITLSLFPTVLIARFLRTSLVEELNKDYIITAKAKGLSERAVIVRHALPNSIIPLLTYLGPLTGGILMGSFVIERIFALPGLGSHLITSISNRDYTLTLGITVFYAFLIVIINTTLDYLYHLIDPRIRQNSGGISGE